MVSRFKARIVSYCAAIGVVSCFRGMFAPPVRQNRTGEVHPDGEDVCGKGGDGAVEDADGECRGHAAILHPDLDGDRPRLGFAETREASDRPREPIAAQVAGRVVDHHRRDEDRAGGGERVAAGGGEGEDREADAAHGDERENPVAEGFVPGELPVEETMDQRTGGDGHHHDFQDFDHHLQRVDLDEAPCEKLHRERRDDRREESGAACHRHRKRHIGFRQKGDDVGGRAAGDASHEDASGRQLAGEAAALREQKAHERHDQKLKPHADRHGPGPFRDAQEVRKRKRRPHAEHDDLDRGHDHRGELHAAPGDEQLRERERHRRAREDRDPEPLPSEDRHQFIFRRLHVKSFVVHRIWILNRLASLAFARELYHSVRRLAECPREADLSNAAKQSSGRYGIMLTFLYVHAGRNSREA